MWKEGNLKIHDSLFHYWLKISEENSQHGIDEGKIYVLMIKRDQEIVASYERDWDVKPSDPDAQLALDFLIKRHN